MKLIVALLLAVAVTRSDASIYMPSWNTAAVPSSIESVLISVNVYYPSITSLGSAISVVELSSPTVVVAESIIDSYEASYSSLIDEIESFYSYPWQYSLDYVSEVTNVYSTLASAISYIESVEDTQTLLSQFQSTLQSLEVSYPSILSVLTQYTDIASPSIYEASQIISHITLTDSSIFASIVAVSTAVSISPTVSEALSYLSSAVYTLPSTVVTEIETIISSPSTVSHSTITSLEACYYSVYTALSYVAAFTSSFSTIDSEMVDYLKAASIVAGIGSAVGSIVSKQMPTLSYELSVIHAAASIESQVTDDLALLTFVEADSPVLYRAESTIEASFYDSPSVAENIYYALDYPSLVQSPTLVRDEEKSHESLVDALIDIISMQSYHSSLSTLTSIEQQLDDAFQSYRTLLTAYQYVQDVTAPSVAAATASILSEAEVVSSLGYILSQVNYVISAVPAISCEESVVEQNAEDYPTIVTYLWRVEDDKYYLPSSSIVSFQELVASYSSVVSAFSYILAYESQFAFLSSLELSFIYVVESDSSLLTQYEDISSYYY